MHPNPRDEFVPRACDPNKPPTPLFNQVYSTLHVRVQEARGLVPPAAVAGKQAALSIAVGFGSQRGVTGGVADVPRPVWNEEFEFEVLEGEAELLTLTLVGPDKTARGTVVLDPAGQPLSSGGGWYPWQSARFEYTVPLEVAQLGELHVQWEYSNAGAERRARQREERARRQQKKERYTHVTVRLIGARGLVCARDGTAPSAFVVAQFGTEVQQTQPVPGSTAPCWMQTFEFPIEDLTAQLSLTVWDQDTGDPSAYHFLGYTADDILACPAAEGSRWLLLTVRADSADGRFALRWVARSGCIAKAIDE